MHKNCLEDQNQVKASENELKKSKSEDMFLIFVFDNMSNDIYTLFSTGVLVQTYQIFRDDSCVSALNSLLCY